MLVNSSITIFHKDFDEINRIEKWIRFNYGEENNPKVWWYGGKGASLNEGYENANDVKIRIPYELNDNLDIANFKIGDIIVKGTIKQDIKTQQDLLEYETYNIMSIVNNDYGNNKHIRLGGK